MKADATLVNAAFALGRSYVPADYSAIFEKQYEGIIAANAAKYKMYGDIATSAGKAIGGTALAYGKRKYAEKVWRERNLEYESFRGAWTKGEGDAEIGEIDPNNLDPGKAGDEAYQAYADELSGEGVADANIPSKEEWAITEQGKKALQQERDDTRRASGTDKQQRIKDNLQKRIDAGRTLTEKEQADYDAAVAFLETDQEAAQDGSIEGMLNVQGDKIIKDGKWVD